MLKKRLKSLRGQNNVSNYTTKCKVNKKLSSISCRVTLAAAAHGAFPRSFACFPGNPLIPCKAPESLERQIAVTGGLTRQVRQWIDRFERT